MKKLFALLASSLLALASSHAATLTISNQNALANGANGVADSTGALHSGSGAAGVIGRMTISDAAISAAALANNVSVIDAGFEAFASTSGTFTLNSLGSNGAFEVVKDFDTRASINSFGGSSIYLWIYKGASRATATEHFLVKLSSTFPTDSETEPPTGPLHLYLRPDTVVQVFAGVQSATTHDYGQGSGPLATFRTLPLNEAPVASAGVASGDEDAASITGTLTATDAESDPFTFAKVADPAHGSVTVLSNGSYTYIPAANYHGTDSFTFKANDGKDSNIATITITINSVPDAPVATGASKNAITGRDTTGQLVATDGDGDTLTYAKVADPTKGVVVVTTAGAYTYTPTPGQLGADSFTFKASDGAGDSNIATISLTIVANSTPEADEATFKGQRDDLIADTLTGSDADNDALTFAEGTPPTHGELELKSDGSFRYMPDSGYIGIDSFTFTVTDGYSASSPATATLVIGSAVPEWTWELGSQLAKQKGTYGTLQSPAPTNIPGARSDAASATDQAGHTYAFGGTGFGETAGPGLLNDLWLFDANTQRWSWIAGGKGINTPGIYGTLGSGNDNNNPGGRSGGSFWIDQAGDLWLFGGTGRDSTTTGNGALNDLWKYRFGSQQWTWKAGANTAKANGTYGTKGTSSAATTPGARSGAVTWIDASGNLWLHGGKGLGASGTTLSNLNDLWSYNTTTEQWTWISGSSAVDASGTYGSKGIAHPTNTPGGRNAAIGWTGHDGQLYLFGGQGRATAATLGYLNDLWRFDIASNSWTWLNGSNTTNVAGVYGSLGTGNDSNSPGARAGAVARLGADASLLLSQGQGSTGLFNDVWSYDSAANAWTWIKGSSKTNGAAVYGTQGTAAPSNTPGARRGALPASDSSGDLWLFGGVNGANSYNDTWSLDLPALPTVTLNAITAITDTTATVGLLVDNNGITTKGSLYFWPVTSPASITEIVLGTVGTTPGTADSAALTALTAGTRYAVQALVQSLEGESSSLIREFTTTGTGGAATANFELSSSNLNEGNLAATVRVVLSQPAAAPYTVTVGTSGTATPGSASDYIAPSATLAFTTGQLYADIAINLLEDIVIDGSETIILTLSAPTGGLALGSSIVHTITITDNDGAPSITTPPASRFAAVGASTTFSVVATGTPPLTYQWKKNGVNVAGATKADYTLAKVALTSIGNYTVEVKGAISPVATSTPAAELFVVDTASRSVAQVDGTSLLLTAKTAGAGLSYEWQKGSTSIGATTATTTLVNLASSDSGDYRCRVYKTGADELFTGITTLTVTSAAPVISSAALPSGYIGTPYSHQIAFTNLPAGTPTSVTITTLPAGLKVSATGLITGIPTAATLAAGVVTAKSITLAAKNASGTAIPVTSSITISPVPPAALGSYVATIERNTSLASNLGGRLDVTITSVGSFTAKLYNGAETYSNKAQLVITAPVMIGDQPGIAGAISFARKGLSSLAVAFTIALPANPLTTDATLTGSLSDGTPAHTAVIAGLRNPFSATNKATQFKNYYTFGLEIPAELAGDLQTPQGNGYGSFTVADLGTLTVAGRTADGIAYSAATITGYNGKVPSYAALAATTPGSLLGTPTLAVVNTSYTSLDGALSWSRSATPTTSKDQTYRSGFGPINLTIGGGNYVGPDSGGVIKVLTINNANNAKLTFAGSSLPSGEITFTAFSIRNLKPTGVVQTVTVTPFNATALPSNPNPYKVAFKLDAKPVGQFSGSFVLPHATASLVRTAKYQGMIIHRGVLFEAMGYFTLPQLPEPGQTLTTSPVLSGQVILSPP